MKLLYSLLAASCFAATGFTQTNMLSTNPVAEQVLLGKYDPGTYVPPTVVVDPAIIAKGIQSLVSAGNGIELLQNIPNPADETKMITVVVKDGVSYKDAFISITDINGRQVKKMPVILYAWSK